MTWKFLEILDLYFGVKGTIKSVCEFNFACGILRYILTTFLFLALNVTGNCGEEVSGAMGFIASPNFPRSRYPSSTSCNWTVTVDEGMVIKVKKIDLSLFKDILILKLCCESLLKSKTLL